MDACPSVDSIVAVVAAVMAMAPAVDVTTTPVVPSIFTSADVDLTVTSPPDSTVTPCEPDSVATPFEADMVRSVAAVRVIAPDDEVRSTLSPSIRAELVRDFI
jgi:hypothetical protein